MIRVLLADDHPVVRAGLRALLAGEPGIAVVGEAATADDAVSAAARDRPDVVLMDLQFGGALTGVDATRRIRSSDSANGAGDLDPPPAVLVLTNYDTDADILGAVEAGASGYLLKDAPPAELVAAVRAAAAGESALAPAIASRLLDRMRNPGVSLSPRELQVLRLVADGLGNAAIAHQLVVTELTVKSHLMHVYAKLGVSSRTAAVSAARRSGLLR